MKPDGLRMLGWAIPILCMTIAGWILFKENQEFDAASMARNQAHRDNEEAAKELDVITHMPPVTRFAAADDKPEEEIAFLTYLRTRAAADGVNFKSWSSQTTEYGKDKTAVPLDPKTASLLKGIRKISAALTLEGPYQNIRKLVGEMESSDRLYTLSNITWTTTKEGTQLAMTVSRYVSPAAPASDKKASPFKPGTKPPVKPGTIPGNKTPVAPGGSPSAGPPGITASGPGITTKP